VISLRKKSDIADFVTTDSMQGADLSHISNFEPLDLVVKDAVEKGYDKLDNAYELYPVTHDEGDTKAERLMESGEGFHAFHSGGWRSRGFTTVDMMSGSGYAFKNPKLEKAFQDALTEGYAEAKQNFMSEHGEQLADVPPDKINYHDLYEMDKGELAESLSEEESNSLGQYEIGIEVRVRYHAPDSTHKQIRDKNPEIEVYIEVEGIGGDSWHEDISFTSLSELKTKLNATIDRIITENIIA